MRGFTGTVLGSLAAAGIGIGLFFIKHEVKEQEARLAELNREIERNQEAIHVLRAEWSFLNDPDRLRALSERHLGMKPLAPAQVATLDTLPRFGEPETPALAAAPKPATAAPRTTQAAAPPPAVISKPALSAPSPTPAVAASKPVTPAIAVKPAQPAVAAKPAQPAAPAAAQGRVIVIQSPALAASDAIRDGGTR